MSKTTFSGPVVSTNGFEGDVTGDVTGDITGDITGDVTGAITVPVSLTADLPVAAPANAGQVRAVSDNGAGDDEFALVVSNGTAWVVISTTALT